MSYMTDLEWMRNLDEFSEEEKKVLLALSHDKYKWRSRDNILQLTRMRPKRLDRTLSYLLIDGLVRPAFGNTSRKIVFGLKERVD